MTTLTNRLVNPQRVAGIWTSPAWALSFNTRPPRHANANPHPAARTNRLMITTSEPVNNGPSRALNIACARGDGATSPQPEKEGFPGARRQPAGDVYRRWPLPVSASSLCGQLSCLSARDWPAFPRIPCILPRDTDIEGFHPFAPQIIRICKMSIQGFSSVSRS